VRLHVYQSLWTIGAMAFQNVPSWHEQVHRRWEQTEHQRWEALPPSKCVAWRLSKKAVQQPRLCLLCLLNQVGTRCNCSERAVAPPAWWRSTVAHARRLSTSSGVCTSCPSHQTPVLLPRWIPQGLTLRANPAFLYICVSKLHSLAGQWRGKHYTAFVMNTCHTRAG